MLLALDCDEAVFLVFFFFAVTAMITMTSVDAVRRREKRRIMPRCTALYCIVDLVPMTMIDVLQMESVPEQGERSGRRTADTQRRSSSH